MYFLKSFIFIILVTFLWSCKKQNGFIKETVVVKGSDTMVNLAQKWAEVYVNKNPKISINVNGGGSGIGITSLLNGTAHIANISRELKEKELRRAETLNLEPTQYKVALDGTALIVNPKNRIDTLTLLQVREIFSGKIRNWKDVGGDDEQIVLYGRENSSGTYEYFKLIILGKDSKGKSIDFAPHTQVLQGTAALGEAIANDVKGIGYGGVGYFAKRNDLKILYLKENAKSAAISPVINKEVNISIIREGVYPLSRYLYCYTNGKPEGAIKNFIDFILSAKGQEIVEQMEYIPLEKVISAESSK